MNAKLTPSTCAHCGEEYHLIDLLDGVCLMCAHKDETGRIQADEEERELLPLGKVFTVKKWFDDSLQISKAVYREYYAKRGGKR